MLNANSQSKRAAVGPLITSEYAVPSLMPNVPGLAKDPSAEKRDDEAGEAHKKIIHLERLGTKIECPKHKKVTKAPTHIRSIEQSQIGRRIRRETPQRI